MAVIKSDPQLSDLETKAEREVAAQYIANETRQLQANENIPYDEAVAMAAAKLKAKLKKENDFFTGSDEKLNLAEESELKADEFLGSDGFIYVVDPESPDGFSRKN